MPQDQTPEPVFIGAEAQPSAAVPPAPTIETTATAEPAVDVMPSLEDLLKAAELKATEHHDAWLRAKAEVEWSPAMSFC